MAATGAARAPAVSSAAAGWLACGQQQQPVSSARAAWPSPSPSPPRQPRPRWGSRGYAAHPTRSVRKSDSGEGCRRAALAWRARKALALAAAGTCPRSYRIHFHLYTTPGQPAPGLALPDREPGPSPSPPPPARERDVRAQAVSLATSAHVPGSLFCLDLARPTLSPSSYSLRRLSLTSRCLLARQPARLPPDASPRRAPLRMLPP